jgi:hypothetical protein
MSLSKPQLKNPAVRFMQWRGGEEGGGRLTWYDKENQQEVEIELPFSFIVLDELTTLTGFNDTQQSGYWSNEVRNSNGILVARTKQGIQARGTYQKIKEMGLNGLKFAQSVYVAFKDEETGELVIGNIKLFGAAFSAWVDFKKKFDISQCAVYITDEPKRAKKGRNIYFIPVFEGQNLNDETKNAAVKLDEELQRYLNTYLQQRPDEDDGGATEEDDEPEDDIHNIPGVDKPAEPAKKAAKEDVSIENLDEAGSDDDDEEDDEPAPAPKKAKAAAKKPGNLKDVAF